MTVVALIVSWISGLFSGGGGAGDGRQDGARPVLTQSSEPRTRPPETQTADTGDATGEIPPEDGVLDVWIQDRRFEIRGGANSARHDSARPTAVPLETVVERARETTGNEDGIRVRIFRAASSRASAEQALKDALEAAGFSEHSLRWASADPGE